ncbi:MAG: glycosyl transferase [Candidatus Omnitrophica bacterium CG07_land_8_20_14_0_80_42_15]|uniref:Glycosyl transferase n=1 Tax=Candidatus Aquitaenariimonas noxiae TaxID=1974741 RepID=A0A2J0KTC4_9BACT|nr:MAG: glycosyl transferase [Candidatus Omnitrophica bacterium CG07_land_8_20_14_0_80_42_15]
MKISVVVPVYNEVNTIEEIISRVQAVNVGLEKEIIIVDDNSTDGTRERLTNMTREKKNVKVFCHDRNLGKGAALRTGFEFAARDITIIQDADLEYDPEEYPNLLKTILDDKADVVYGSRFLRKTYKTFPFWHYAGNKFLTALFNFFNNRDLTDMETCYKVFKKEILRSITLKSNRFAFEPEFSTKVARKGFRICEVPIKYNKRSYSEGKKFNWKDRIIAFFAVFRFQLSD